MNTKRILSEVKELRSEKNQYYYAKPIEDNLYEWIASIRGPKQTPYENGVFTIHIVLPEEYPFKPPKLQFITKIFHPNISYNGDICLDLLKKEWSPILNISSLLLSIISLLNDPNPEDPLVDNIAYIYKNNKEEYKKIAREWTINYAL